MKYLLCYLVALSAFLQSAAQAQHKYKFTTIRVPGAMLTQANGINTFGRIAGLYVNGPSPDPERGFLLSGGVYTTVDPAGAANTVTPRGINDAGQIVGDYEDASFNRHGFFLHH
jgi:hypothetical protein